MGVGGAITVLDKGLYYMQNLKLLSDVKTYKKISTNPTSHFKSILQNIVQEGVKIGVMIEKQADFIIIE